MSINDKLVRLSEPSWRKVREAAYKRESNIKAILEDIINENLTASEI